MGKYLTDKGYEVSHIFLKGRPKNDINPDFHMSWNTSMRTKYKDKFDEVYDRVYFALIGDDSNKETEKWKEEYSVPVALYILNFGSAMSIFQTNAKGDFTAGYNLLKKEEESEAYDKCVTDDSVFTLLGKRNRD